MDEIHALRYTLTVFDNAVHLQKLNQELLEYLVGSMQWLFRYSEKCGYPLQKKEEICQMIEKAEFLIEKITAAGYNVERCCSYL